MDTKDERKKKGSPVGNREYQGNGDARPELAGGEGGLGFLGDQRGKEEEKRPSMDVDTPEGSPIRPSDEEDDEKRDEQ
jgi:hypothetical protein